MSQTANIRELELKAIRYRRRTLEIIYNAGAGHTGGSLSCLDLLNVLYNHVLNVSPASFHDPNRDRYVQSKGHSVESLFVILADRGFYADSELETLCQYKSHFVGHPTRKVPGVEQNTGGLGHGLPIATGMAIGAKLDQAAYRVFTLLGDGELAEGSNWEAAMSASHYRLDNLTAIIDCNLLQITGATRDVMSNEPLAEKFDAFGWQVECIDGHDYPALIDVLSTANHPSKPKCVIANTIKGKGISFMENVGKWHHGVPSQAEMEQALHELDLALQHLMEVSS